MTLSTLLALARRDPVARRHKCELCGTVFECAGCTEKMLEANAKFYRLNTFAIYCKKCESGPFICEGECAKNGSISYP